MAGPRSTDANRGSCLRIHRSFLAIVAAAALLASWAAFAGETTATLHRITADGEAEAVGTATFSDSPYGLRVTPTLHDMKPPGPHGAHVHAGADCGAGRMPGHATAGTAAGGHYDPADTDHHAGPYGAGHLGDLPNLIVENDGKATIAVLAPRLSVSDLHGRALMLHAEPDRYADHGDHSHGKGGARAYCGVIE